MTDTLNPLATIAVIERLVAERDALKAYIRELEDELTPEIIDLRVGLKSALEGLKAAEAQPAQRQPNNMKLADNVTVLPVVTNLDLSVERVLQAAIDANPTYVMVIGQDADGGLYFASSKADGGEALWWMEKAERALMEVSE